MREVVIVSMARTPFGKFGGKLSGLTAAELGGLAIKAALERSGISGQQVDEVIMGMVVTAGAGQIPARQAAIKGGIHYEVPGITINKVCGSGMKAITLGTQIIKAGDADIIVAGGMESMSNIPYLSPSARWGSKMGNQIFVDAMIKDGLWCPENNVHMATLGGAVAVEYGVSREEQDQWAQRSQQRWHKAESDGFFAQERFLVSVKFNKEIIRVDKDESPRYDSTLEGLGKLKPIDGPTGTITAGNAPGISDGAAVVILASREKAETLELPILARIAGHAQISQPSKYIATVPGLAIQKLVKKYDLSIKDIDLIEINEAFAAVPLVSGKVIGLDSVTMDEKVNVNGSAIAVGHPIGVTGARLIMTIIYELKRRKGMNGVCAICSGMAQGDAVWLQRV